MSNYVFKPTAEDMLRSYGPLPRSGGYTTLVGMTLVEAVERIHALPAAGVIFAERIDGEFKSESRCAVLELSDEELEQPVSHIASRRAPGLEYFLEISVAVDLLGSVDPADSASVTTLLVRYAEDDA